MKKVFYLLLLLCLSNLSFAQVTTTFWATSNATATGWTDGVTITRGNMQVGNMDADRGYAVFDLGSIPAGSTIISVTAGIDISAYSGGADPGDAIDGFGTDLSRFTVPISLYSGLVGGGAFVPAAFGGAAGDPSFPSSALSVGLVAAAVPSLSTGGTTGSITLSYRAASAVGVYTITGLSGTTTDISAPGHAPYLQVTYCPPPANVTASGPTGIVCGGSVLSLSATATGATNYSWTGPNSFTSTDQNPTFNATTAATGVYSLTATNVCGAFTATATAVSNAVTVEGGPITGVTTVYTTFTDALSDATPGGVWATSNAALATIGQTGVDTGISPGIVTITYTTPGGCVYSTQLQVIQSSVTTQLPVNAGTAGGTGTPIAWYPFCGDTTDRSLIIGSGPYPLGEHGIAITPPTLTTDRFGIADDAYQFNGVNNLLYRPTFFPVLAPTFDFTYSCWFTADTLQNSIILYNGDPASDGFGFVMNNGNYVNTLPGNYVSVLFAGVGLFLPTPVTLNRWHNLVLKKSGNSYNFYIDNVSIGFFINNYNTLTSVFQLGGGYGTTLSSTPPHVDRPFKGKIDDVIFYNRQVSDADRDSLYNFNPDARPFTLGNDTTICGDSLTLYPNPQSPGNAYYWVQDGIDTISRDTSAIVYPTAGLTGNQVYLEVGKLYGCFAYDAVIVYKAPIPINIGPATINLCAGDSIILADNVPHSPSTTFLWSTGDTTSSITVHTSGTYEVSVDSIYHYTAFDAHGVPFADSSICVGHDSVQVHVYAVPIIGIPDHYTSCIGVPDTIRPYHDTAYQYVYGLLNQSPFPYPVDTPYIVDRDTGTLVYWIKVTDTGCTRIDTTTVLIQFDTLTFFAKDTAFCLGGSWTPNIGHLLVVDNGIGSYQWTPTAGIPFSHIPNPTISPDTSAEYYLTVSLRGCPDIVDSFHIDVQPNPVVFPGNNRSVCQYDTAHLGATVTPSWYTHYIYSWSPGAGLDDSTNGTVVFHPTDTTSLINMVVTVSTPAGCSTKDSLLLFVHPGNYLTDSPLVHTVCPGDSIMLTPHNNPHGDSLGVVIASYSWTPGTFLSDTFGAIDSTTGRPWVKATTTTDYSLVTRSQYGCKDTLFYRVNVAAAAVLYFGADSVTITPGQSYLISPQTNCVNFTWYPPLDIDDIHSSTPTVTPPVNQTYTVYASTENGCSLVDSIKIRLAHETPVTVPNAFTPGAGINSTFALIQQTKTAVTLNYFRIYNRWGNLMFETTDINQGWDGTYKGKPQPFDVYVYEFEVTPLGGQPYKRVGNLTLLR